MTFEDRREAGQPANHEEAAGEAIRASSETGDPADATASKPVWQLLPDMATGGGPESWASNAAPIEQIGRAHV